MFVCAGMLVGIYLETCVCARACAFVCIYSTLDKIMAWFLIFQSSTVSNVRAWLIPWSLTP